MGGYVEGSINGTLFNAASNESDLIQGTFRFKRYADIKSSSISGHIWTDINGDGIRDAGDALPSFESPGSYMELKPTIDSRFELIPLNSFSRDNGDGTYTINNVLQGDTYSITYNRININPTLKDRGNDEDFDSDFNRTTNPVGTYPTDAFFFEEGDPITNIDLGLWNSAALLGCQVSIFGCDGNATANVLVVGGTAPFTYTWSNGSTGTGWLGNLAAGSYSLTVTDAIGESSDCSFTVPIADNTINLIAFKDVGTNTPNTYEEGVDELLEGVKFKLWYSHEPNNVIEGETLADGTFAFNNVNWIGNMPGIIDTEVVLEVVPPTGLELVIHGQGINPDLDSDFDQDNNQHSLFIQECDGEWTLFAGFKEQ